MPKWRYVLMEEANDGTAPGVSAGGAESQGAGVGAGEASLLSQGAGGQGGAGGDQGGAPAAPGAATGHDWLNEKFHVKNDKGELDVEASAKKQAESYTTLEKRMKDVGLPPESADGYEFQAPEGIPLDPAMTKAFKDEALALGLTQKQYGAIMTKYINELGNLPAMMDGYMKSKAAEAKPVMAKAWGGEHNLQANLQLANQTFDRVFGDAPDEVKQNAELLGNSPAFLFLLAQYGKESQEDQSMLLGQNLMPQNEIDALYKDSRSAYWDATNPGHQAAVEKVRKHHEAQARMNSRN